MGKGANQEVEAALAASRAEAKSAKSAWAAPAEPTAAEVTAAVKDLSISTPASISSEPSLGEALSPPVMSPTSSMASPAGGAALPALAYRVNDVTSPALLECVTDMLAPVKASLPTLAVTGLTYAQVLANAARDAITKATGNADLCSNDAVVSMAVDANVVKALTRAFTSTNTTPNSVTLLPELDRVFLSRSAATELRDVATTFRAGGGSNANGQRKKIDAVLARMNVMDLVKVWEYACALLRFVCNKVVRK